ncbi:cupin domain-containing protein [Corynebacterium accolens]|uniref:cupin domain-containing protein n=1 Tax=Corynebacterium accolens TaxID=38284 RepID=UPI00254AB4FB|nr:cupin domain-containing protein [Corynebacterium accolens]MDK8468754.1 cupin domain-containing protein [Corynebacterium accolens]MDK8497360.1 cupin domain-containing protein [Corynebacterium accolens]MDK8592148.1 cupin domain-containing protein [Corynebacterium accolens]
MNDSPNPASEPRGAHQEAPHSPLIDLDLMALAPPTDPERKRPGVKRVLNGERANLILFSFSPGQTLPDHKAAHPIIVQAIRGEVNFTCGEKTVTLSPGNMVHLPAYTVHSVAAPLPEMDSDSPAQQADAQPALMLLTMLTG